TAKGPGTATITATCGSKSATCTVTVKQPLTGITLSATSATLNVGGTKTLTVTYNPSNTTDSKTVTWTTSNSTVATVSNGMITAKGPGTATITATCGNKSATCTVTVKQPLNSISLSDTNITMNVGTNEILSVVFNPSNTTDSKTVIWTTSNSTVATVSNGKITAKGPGTAIITATCGNKSATCTVTVKQPLTGISLSSARLKLNVGESNTLSVIYNEANTTDNRTVIWTTSNSSIATVSNGKVVAVAPGTVTITATCGSNTATCELNVKQPLISIELDKNSLTMDIGDSNTLNVTYNPSNTTDNKDVMWSSNNESVAIVVNGKVTAIGAGTATITALCGNQKYICTVKVNTPEIDISISETNINLEIGNSKKIEITYNSGSLPENKTICFKSSNSSVATVSESGVITAVSSGTVTIIVETNDGEQLASCEVTVQNDSLENTQQPTTETPSNNETDKNEQESTESDSNKSDVTDTKTTDASSQNNGVNTILVVIAVICAIAMIGMFCIVIVMIKKRK
ncbi:MAG: Ig domain-containing protein, partial [Lachnospira sp.]|nr:Ig domain-containing protein [Lachnospira sp.]